MPKVRITLPLVVIVSALVALSRPSRAQDAGDAGGIFLPGTQPGQLTMDLRSPALCASCHGGYADYAANDTWQGTMMANAARDPLFHAALTVANQDRPGSGDLCLRCHSPRGWLFGRSSPPLISNLTPDDFESVQCDFCHRLTKGPTGTPHIGNAQYFVADDFVRRGPIQEALAPHEWEYSPYHSESKLCGLCHDVSNPLENGFAIERTYTEWATSDFAAEGKTCQSCHLPSERGKGCGAPGMPDRDVHRHELAGGNYWMPLVIAAEHPELGRQAAFERTVENAKKMLAGAASLSIEVPPSVAQGENLDFQVRVENKTGHKLPTGYPEGRRCWLEVEVTDADGGVVLRSGLYEEIEARRIDDPQLRTYEVRMAASGVEGFHFILQNELLQDNRIPPRGFVARPDTAPVGRSYPVVGTGDAGEVIAHWDEAPYVAGIPASARGPLSVKARLLYQTTSREYVESLRDTNTTDGFGAKMVELWQKHGRAPPFEMAASTTSIEITHPPSNDAGPPAYFDASVDHSQEGGNVSNRKSADESGCNCKFTQPIRSSGTLERFPWGTTAPLWGGLLMALLARRRTRHALSTVRRSNEDDSAVGSEHDGRAGDGCVR